jgi:hypothetical protein
MRSLGVRSGARRGDPDRQAKEADVELSELVAAAQPAALESTLADKVDELAAAAHEHGAGALTSLRRAEHAGHEIVVRTTYQITIDGEPFDVHMNVDNSGRVHYHGLPTRDFASVIDLVAKVIDQFPGEFGPGTGGHTDRPEPSGPPDHPDHDHHHGGG